MVARIDPNTVSVKPHVAPLFLVARLKGRLQHALREAGTPVDFSRKLSVRSLGDVVSAEVEQYIRNQKGYRISVGSVMPDHIHLALRGNIEQPAQEIALAFLNNLAYLLGSKAVWQFGFYAGTFGEYDMRCVRR